MLHNIISPHEAIIPPDNIIVHLVFAVIDNYSLPIKVILVNQHLSHRWLGNLSTNNLCTPDTRGRVPTPLPYSNNPLLLSIPCQITPVHALTPHLSYIVLVKYVSASCDSYKLLPITVLNITIRPTFVKEKDCVLCEVRTKVLYMI